MAWSKNTLLKIGLVLIVLYLLFLIFKDLKKSFFFSNKNHLNLIIFQEKTIFYSFDLKDKSSYYLVFYPDMKVQVPGGYGEYRLGGLLKLAALEKKPEIIQNTFSTLTNTLVDFYYYPDKTIIYFGKDDRKSNNAMSLLGIMKSKSNASFFDRIFTYYLFLNQKSQQQLIYDKEKFNDTYQGYFYNEKLRSEKINVQLIYQHSYSTAVELSKLIEGEGIRVVDISENEAGDNINKNCLIQQSGKKSLTAFYLSNYFHCDLTYNNQTGVYDLVFFLNSLENKWEYN